jgi:hypothetical protein
MSLEGIDLKSNLACSLDDTREARYSDLKVMTATSSEALFGGIGNSPKRGVTKQRVKYLLSDRGSSVGQYN